MRALGVIIVAAAAVGVAVGLLPIVFGLLVVVALAVLAASLVDARVPLVLFIFSIPYSSLTKVGGETYSLTATEALVALLLVAWIGRRIAARRFEVRGGPTLAMLALLFVVSLFSTLTAEDFPDALKELIKLAEMLVVGLYAASELERPEDTRLAIVALLLAGASEAVVGLVQFATGRGPETFAIGPFMRAHGNFEQPNALAGYLGLLLPLGVAFSFRRSPERPIVVLATAIIAMAILATLSRGSWVGITLGLAMMALFWGDVSRRLLVGAAALGIVVLLLSVAGIVPRTMTERIAVLFENFVIFDVTQVERTPTNWPLVERMAHWQAGWEMATDHPLMGVGPGNYEAVYPRYYKQDWVEALGHAHNYYLNSFAELGIIGLVVFLGFCASVFLRIGQGLRETLSASSVRRALLLGALGAMVTFSVHNMFDNMFVHGIGVQFALILGLVEAGFVASPQRGRLPVGGTRVVSAVRGA
jgi:O-antigen ligase